MNTASRNESSSGPAKAICYRCSYVGKAAGESHCPSCDFPLIQEAGRGPDVAPTVDKLFDRVSVRVGAPPLPGVDRAPRKAQLLIQARRKRQERARTIQRLERARTEARHRRVTTIVACVSAVAAGIAAAVVMNGGW